MQGRSPLSREQWQAVFNAFEGTASLRNRTLWTFGTATGFRIAEILSLRIRDVQTAPRGAIRAEVSVHARNTKGRQHGRTVPLSPQARRALALWLAHLADRDGYHLDRPLWPSSRGGWRLVQPRTILAQLDHAATRAGIGLKVSCHTMRKCFAQAVHETLGRDIRQTQLALGHTSISSTAHYIATMDTTIATTIATLHFGDFHHAEENEDPGQTLLHFALPDAPGAC